MIRLGTAKPQWVFLIGLCIVAGILASVRLSQLVIEQPASGVSFTQLHNLRWTPATGALEPTGDDPHGFLDIPAGSIPLTGVVMEFLGPLPPGPSYIYPSPAHYPGLQISDNTVVTGKVEPIPGGFLLRFPLPASRIARFDLPDELHSAFLLHRVVFQTPFAGSSSRVFSLLVGSIVAAVALLTWIFLGELISRHRALEYVGAALLVGAKLWIARDLHLTVFADAMHDDALFMSLGHSIANGDWLGRFNELTLSKGPVFPIFIALAHLSQIPFLQAEASFHAIACVIFVVALRPAVRSAGLRLVLLAVLLFDPHTLSVEVVAQVLRSGIQPALTLLTLAGFVGLVVRLGESRRAALGWAVLAGLAFSAFWFCREESIWLVPSLLLLTVVGAWRLRNVVRPWATGFALLLLPFLIWAGARTTLGTLNRHYYGERITIDVATGGYPDAYAALLRITPAETIPGVPVTKETRLRAYAVSPSFAKLQPYLEGSVGNAWAQNGWEGINHPSAKKEMRGWFQWALREAASKAGEYHNAATASAYWHKVADEINAACDAGRLAAGPRRSGFTPRWDPSLWPVLRKSLGTAVSVAMQFSDFNPQSPVSSGSPERVAFFSRMLHEAPVLARTPPTIRTHLRVVLFHLYASVGLGASALALLALILIACNGWKQRAHLLPLALLLTLMGGAFSLILIVALVDATSFSTTHAMYLAPATPLLLACWVLAPSWALETGSIRSPKFFIFIKRAAKVPRWKWVRSLRRPESVALIFFAFAVIFASARWYQTTTVLRGSDVKFSVLNEMNWAADKHQVARAGGDPFGLIQLPAPCIPVRTISVDFIGPYSEGEGVFYVYQHAANLPGTVVDQASMATGKVTRTAAGFTVDWTLQDSKVVRIDLPDFLQQPLEIAEIRISTAFAWAGSTPFRLMLLCLAGAVLSLTRLPWNPTAKTRLLIMVVTGGVLIATKLALASDVPLSVYGFATHDDALFVGEADSIRHGQWLGSFNEITLAKGPVYSVFLAAVEASGFRMQLAQAVFHALACFLFVLALRPLLSSSRLQFLLFAVLLADPHSLSAEVVGRPLRSGIHPALTLLALAGFIGLMTRANAAPRRILIWSLFAGFALSAFWFCREEGVWLIPSLLLLGGGAAVAVFRRSRGRALAGALLALPVGIWFASTWTLRLVNSHFYGAPISLDVKDGNFPRAYGALVRITPAESIPLVPVSKETRLRAYAFSPAFKELEPLLEGPLGDGWSQPGWEGVNHPRAKKEMRGWFQWAVREAAALAGRYRTAATANEYWGRVADEINAACDRGDLPAGPRRNGFLPRWDSSHWPEIRDSWSRAVDVVIQFAGFGLHLNPSEATPAQFALFARVTHEKPSDGHPPVSWATEARTEIFHVYNAWGRWLTFASLAATALAVVQAMRRKIGAEKILVLIALLGGALALTLIVALVNATAFPAINGSYLSPASPLVIATWVLAPFWAWQLTRTGQSDGPGTPSVD